MTHQTRSSWFPKSEPSFSQLKINNFGVIIGHCFNLKITLKDTLWNINPKPAYFDPLLTSKTLILQQGNTGTKCNSKTNEA